jgi:rSAM/selenodomain-associated transferase 2
MQVPTIAVVIPALNEEATLARALGSLRSQVGERVRLLVADGGSTDDTRSIAERHGARWVETASKGRGCQIAEALRRIHEDVVVIVHADTILPGDALERIRQWLVAHPDCPGGSLGHRFEGSRWVYRLVEWWDERRARRGMSYGDQTQFFRRELLERRGGFPDQPIMEDLELSRRLLSLGEPAYLNCPVIVSPRRFERLGWLRSAAVNFLLRLAYHVGGTPACHKLYRYYYDGA